MLLDGGADAVVLALERRVFPAHQALELGELADHLGDEVGLGEAGGALRERRVGAHARREVLRQGGDAGDALALRPELLVEDDGVELGQPVFQAGRLVGLPEELRVREPRPDHPLVAGGDRLAAVGGHEVRDQDEGRRQVLGAALAQHEALLVRPDGRADRLGGDVEEGLVERAHQHHRPLHEARHLLQQSLVLHEVEAAGEGEVAGVVQDHVLAPVGVEDDLRALQGLDVVVEPAHLDRLGGEEAVAVGHRAGRNPADRNGDHLRRFGLRPEGGDDRLQRAHPAQAARLGRGRAPAHGFRPGEASDDLGQELGQDVECLAAGPLDHREVELALLRVGDGRGLIEAREPRALQEALDGRLGGADPRAAAFLAHGLAPGRAGRRCAAPSGGASRTPGRPRTGSRAPRGRR